MYRVFGSIPMVVAIALGAAPSADGFEVIERNWVSDPDCSAAVDPIRLERLDSTTFVLRESPCIDREAPFLFLLLGTEKALLVDSGTQDGVVLAELVGQKLAEADLAFTDLTVAHTHSHLDHRSGDVTLAAAGATVVGPTVEDVREFWGLEAWPEGGASLQLGGRLVEVLPIPGHNENSIAFFDHGTRALLSGDSLLRGSINVVDLGAFRQSVARLSRFADRVAPRVVLGGHLEREDVPLGLPMDSVEDLVVLGERTSFLRPIARGDDFTVVYLRPLLIATGGGFLLLLGGLIRGLARRRAKRREWSSR